MGLAMEMGMWMWTRTGTGTGMEVRMEENVLPKPTPMDTTLMIAANPPLLSLKLPESEPDAPAALSAAISAAEASADEA